MESYRQEVIRKRRTSRIFWIIVFIFATFLYFFFQGYYPNIRLGLEEISKNGGISSSGESLVKAFGIINVKASPNDTTLSLSGQSYGNNEKKMVNYGDYTLYLSRGGYLGTKTTFTINREKPYFIENITLIPKPEYQAFSGKYPENLTKISESLWLSTMSGSIYSLGSTFSGAQVIMSGSYHHIGDGYFLSGKTLVQYDVQGATWSPIENTKWSTLSKRCRDITVVENILYCPDTKEALSQNGYSLTGVIRIGHDALVTKNAVYFYEKNGLSSPVSLSGVTLSDEASFFRVGSTPYMVTPTHTGAINLTNSGDILSFPIEDIIAFESVGNSYAMIGTLSGSRTLWITDNSFILSGTLLSFPNIPLDHLRMKEISGNLWIKTGNALLFVYRGGNKVEWIIDGEIKAWSDTNALYMTDGTLWKADWQEKK